MLSKTILVLPDILKKSNSTGWLSKLPVKEKLDDEIFCVDTLATPSNLLKLGIK